MGGVGGVGGSTGRTKGLYERNALSASLPSLAIDDDGSTDTASVHSGSTTPDYTRRPSNSRSRSSDKFGQAFAANTSKTEERLRREVSKLRVKKRRRSHQCMKIRRDHQPRWFCKQQQEASFTIAHSAQHHNRLLI